MKNANLSKCANPECGERFKRLGDGKLFVRPAASNGKQKQKALWLCQECSRQFDLRYDRQHEEFHLVRRRAA
jgi:hypothetical protein